MSFFLFYEILKGSWFLSKTIEDRLTPATATMVGTITFTPSPNEGNALIYQEEGTLLRGSYEGKSSQTYLYRFRAPYVADIYFSDNRVFHTLNLSSGRTRVTHPCGEDMYKGRYNLISPSHLEIRWIVRGPRKDYEMKSILMKDMKEKVIPSFRLNETNA